MNRESQFQSDLQDHILKRLPDAVILKNDPTFVQGIPDLVIFYGGRYAMLECKRSSKAKHQPNQDYYINLFNDWSYASFIYPENEEEVLNGMEQALRS